MKRPTIETPADLTATTTPIPDLDLPATPHPTDTCDVAVPRECDAAPPAEPESTRPAATTEPAPRNRRGAATRRPNNGAALQHRRGTWRGETEELCARSHALRTGRRADLAGEGPALLAALRHHAHDGGILVAALDGAGLSLQAATAEADVTAVRAEVAHLEAALDPTTDPDLGGAQGATAKPASPDPLPLPDPARVCNGAEPGVPVSGPRERHVERLVASIPCEAVADSERRDRAILSARMKYVLMGRFESPVIAVGIRGYAGGFVVAGDDQVAAARVLGIATMGVVERHYDDLDLARRDRLLAHCPPQPCQLALTGYTYQLVEMLRGPAQARIFAGVATPRTDSSGGSAIADILAYLDGVNGAPPPDDSTDPFTGDVRDIAGRLTGQSPGYVMIRVHLYELALRQAAEFGCALEATAVAEDLLADMSIAEADRKWLAKRRGKKDPPADPDALDKAPAPAPPPAIARQLTKAARHQKGLTKIVKHLLTLAKSGKALGLRESDRFVRSLGECAALARELVAVVGWPALVGSPVTPPSDPPPVPPASAPGNPPRPLPTTPPASESSSETTFPADVPATAPGVVPGIPGDPPAEPAATDRQAEFPTDDLPEVDDEDPNVCLGSVAETLQEANGSISRYLSSCQEAGYPVAQDPEKVAEVQRALEDCELFIPLLKGMLTSDDDATKSPR